jgi:dihydrodipicolinate synthase/N-acetylneuraminate lyase
MSAQEAIDRFAHMAELGFDELIVSLPNVYEPDAFEPFEEQIVSAVRDIKPAGR